MKARSIATITVIVVGVAVTAVALSLQGDASKKTDVSAAQPESTSTTTPSTALPPGAHTGHTRETRTFGNRGTLEPAPPDAKPERTADDAWAAYVRSGLFPVCDGPSADLEWGLYSDSQAAQVQPDRSMRPLVVRRPAWVVQCANVQIQPAGPTGSGGPASTLNAVLVVESVNGEVLLGYTVDPTLLAG
jgi:hypothetical protein